MILQISDDSSGLRWFIIFQMIYHISGDLSYFRWSIRSILEIFWVFFATENQTIICCNFGPSKCSSAAQFWFVWLEMLTEVGSVNLRQKPPKLRDNWTPGAMTLIWPETETWLRWYQSHGSWGRTWVYIVVWLTDGETLSREHLRVYIERVKWKC